MNSLPPENQRSQSKTQKINADLHTVNESPVINLTSSSRESSNKQAVVSASLDTV